MQASTNHIDLATFKRATKGMIKTNSDLISRWDRYERTAPGEYTPERIKEILEDGTLETQQQLSRHFFYQDGFYSRIILHYATLLKYIGVLIPKIGFKGKIKSKSNDKKYFLASKFCDNNNFPTLFINCSLKVLIDGRYYGFITYNKDKMYLIDLPYRFCRTRYKDLEGNELVEFNLQYFNSITDEQDREDALAFYPRAISNEYRKMKKGKRTETWVLVPPEIAVTFAFFDNARPLFLSMIPAALQYDDAVETDRERDKEEIRKIIVQTIPHNNQNEFLLEPDEVEELHTGAVGMLKDNDNIRVLTTYGNVDAIVSKTSNDSAANSIKQMLQNIYSKAGVSGQIFASDSNLAIKVSIRNDIALMMILANQYSTIITNILNKQFGNTNINFKYQFLPISYQNDDEYLDTALKLGNSGYSFILPALAMGITQGDLVDLKSLENDLLELHEKLIPLATSYTQSSNGEGNGKVGRPALNPEDKTDKTIQNEAAENKTE